MFFFSPVNISSSLVGVWDQRSQSGWSGVSRTFKRSPRRKQSSPTTEKCVCFYHRCPCHLIADCPAWNKSNDKPKSVTCISTAARNISEAVPSQRKCDVTFQPLILAGSVSLSEADECPVPIKILHDTGVAPSFLSAKLLNLGEPSFCGSYIVVCGIGLASVCVPLHKIHLCSLLVCERLQIAVCSELPVEGVDAILGNDLAGGKVFPIPEVVPYPSLNEVDELQQEFPTDLPMCATTRSQGLQKKLMQFI